MNDRCARIATLIALVPFTAGLFTFEGFGAFLPSGASGLRFQCAQCTGIACISVLWLWRRYVHWNGRRVASTLAATAGLFGHLVVWAPLWPMKGCADQDILRGSQSTSLLGLWGIACTLVWWRTVFARRRRPTTVVDSRRGPVMTPNAVRLCLGIGLVPALLGWACVAELTYRHWFGGAGGRSVTFALLTTAALAIVSWLAIWRRTITWSRRTTVWTVGIASALIAAQIVATSFSPSDTSAAIVAFAFALWFGGTAWVWRGPGPGAAAMTALPDDSAGPLLRCPACSYDMRGLSTARCPECGWSSTIDDLVIQNADRLAVLATPDV